MAVSPSNHRSETSKRSSGRFDTSHCNGVSSIVSFAEIPKSIHTISRAIHAVAVHFLQTTLAGRREVSVVGAVRSDGFAV